MKRPLRQADAAILHRVADLAATTEPPAKVGAGPPKQVLINFKVAEATAVALAKRAVAEGVTQKQLVIQAFEAIGLPINPYDREDRRAPRRADAA